MSLNTILLNKRHGLPIATYPGLKITGAKVSDIVTNPRAQLYAQGALHERYRSPFVLSAMDLSAEAEAFGCAVLMSDTEVPTVTGRLITSLEQAKKLVVPQPGDKRTAVYIEAVRLLTELPGEPFVLAGCIAPFSLVARLVGVGEAMEYTITKPGMMHMLLEKCAVFLVNYLKLFRAAGARGVIMADPVAGLLSPRSLLAFSSVYVRHIAIEVCGDDFDILLHNCAAKLSHLSAIRETGLKTFHFGVPMDIVEALGKITPDVVLCGNLDPAAVFVRLPPDDVTARAKGLLAATAGYRNFALSSGCDVPPDAPLASLDAFYRALD